MKLKSLSALTIVAAGLAPFGVHAANLQVPSTYATIQLAIDAAVSGDVVRVAPGTYHENLVIDSKAISVIGAEADATIIDGSAVDRVFTISNVTSGQVVLARLTIRNGVTPAGAGIFAYTANLFLRDSVLTGNSGCSGVALRLDFGTLRLLRNRIHANQSHESWCPSGADAALRVFVGGLNYFDYNVIADNAMSGMDAYGDGNRMYFRHNVFRNNVQSGGALAGGLTARGAFDVENNLFANNSGIQTGGAYLAHHDAGEGHVRNNSFSGNDGATAGAMSLEGYADSTLHVVNNLLNDDREYTPEIYCDPFRAPVTIAASNVFASDVSDKIDGNCVTP